MSERTIIDDKGLEWQVVDVPPALLRQRVPSYQLSHGWLCFSDGDGRRVRVERDLFAGDWRHLNAAELNRLLAEALRDSEPQEA